MAEDRKLKKVVKQGEIFTDFWLGVASAAVHGFSKAWSVTPEEKAGTIDGLIERAAEGVKDAASVLQQAAARADEQLKALNAEKSTEAPNNVAPVNGDGRTDGGRDDGEHGVNTGVHRSLVGKRSRSAGD